MNTLYYAPGACSLSVHIVLELIGEPYNAVRVDPSDAEYQRLNPAAQVPSLALDDGEVLTQCAAVLRYLSRTHPSAELDGDPTALAQAHLERWSAFLTGDLHPAFFPVFMPQRYTTAADDASLNAVRQAGIALVRRRLGLLDVQLNGREHIVGDSRTIVDCYSVPMVRWASSMLSGGLGDFPAVKAHHERMLADGAVVRVMQEEGLIPA